MSSGVVRPKPCLPSVRRISSAPETMLPPLVRAAHLQHHAVAALQLAEVVALQDHVVEFEKGQRLLAVEAELDAVEGQHAVDREMRADVAQQVDPAELVEPVGVVEQQRVGGAVAELHKGGDGGLDASDVGGDLLVGHHSAGLVPAGRVADAGGAAAHEHDRFVTMFLHQAHEHDLHQAADVEAVGGEVEADVACHDAGLEGGRKRLFVGALEHEAAGAGFL